MRFLSTTLLLLVCSITWAQLELDQELRMTGQQASDRSVLQVLPPTSGDHGVPLSTVRNQSVSHATASGGASITMALNPAPAAYTPGMLVSFALSSSADSAAMVNVNGLGAVPLLKDGVFPLDSAELHIGIPYTAIYANGVFHLLKRTSSACPRGFDIVSKDYCIELQPDTAVRWYWAASRCAAKGARLCSMGEWMRACKKLNLEPSISRWEWVDSAANSASDAKAMGLDPVNATNPDCEYGRPLAPTLYANYRCCYSR